jgi:peptidoglycan-associated lipoprotein
MLHSSAFQSRRNFSLILICAMLGACATTQKSSTGSGDQTAAPISEAAKPQTTAKPGETPKSPASGAAGAPAKSNSNSADSAGAAGAASGNTGAKQGSSESSAASSDNDEAAQSKRQLAEQDAQINKLRNDQQTGAGREEADAAMQPERQSAAAGTEQPASPGPASTPAPTPAPKGQDEMAVFPANASAEESAGSEAVVPRTLERSVYFDYDQSSVPEKYDSMLVTNAAYLKAHPNVKTEIQGNCDERGSREYNLALGARRAESVKRALELAGADGSRISAISFGSEKPVANGKDEESYSQNRRVDIVY